MTRIGFRDLQDPGSLGPGNGRWGRRGKGGRKGKNETGSVDPRKADTGGRSSPACPLDIFSILSTWTRLASLKRSVKIPFSYFFPFGPWIKRMEN